MSIWETIEDQMVEAIEQLTSGETALLATVKGRTVRDRKILTAAIGRELLPAAYVLATGREASEKVMRRPGAAAFAVILATRSLRSDDEARTGADDVTGMFDLSEQVAAALQDLTVATDRRLLFVDERVIGGEEGMLVWEQRYEVRRQAELSAPTFGGTALAGLDSEVHVELGVLRRASSSFSFPGVDGVFERNLGLRDRAIKWRGQLRAADDTALNDIESAIEAEVSAGQAKTIADSCGRSHESCVMSTFLRRGPRQKDELTGEALQNFEIEFTQLNQ